MTTPSPSSNPDARFWDKTSQKYSKSAIADQEGYQRTLDKTLTFLQPTHSVLELGCGTGSTAIHLARESRVGSYLGTDISSGMIAIANEKISPSAPTPENKSGDNNPEAPPPPPPDNNNNNNNLRFQVATAEELVSAPESEKYDVVLGFNYLHLVRDLPGTLKSISALTKPGGLFLSKTPCIRDMTLGMVLLPVMPLARAVGLAPFVGGFTSAELKRQMEAAGFEVLEMEYHSGGKSSKGVMGDERPFVAARKKVVT